MYISLNGGRSPDNARVIFTEIGDSMERALLCYTDNVQCCSTTDMNTGRWFDQNGADVGDQNSGGDLFVTKGPNVVRLHRRNGTSPSGTYSVCCEVPDARLINRISCVIIGRLMFVNSKIPFLAIIILCNTIVFYYSGPPVSVQVSGGGATPTAGESYQLTCSVPGAENLNPTTTYRWTRNSGSGQTQVGANSNTLSFTPLRLADAASYVCGVTVSSSYLASDITAMNSFDVRIQCE